MKRIALVTIGTQGDVQPYLALAIALKARGYSVVLGASEEFQDMVEGHGVEFHTLGPSIQAFLKDPDDIDGVTASIQEQAASIFG